MSCCCCIIRFSFWWFLFFGTEKSVECVDQIFLVGRPDGGRSRCWRTRLPTSWANIWRVIKGCWQLRNKNGAGLSSFFCFFSFFFAFVSLVLFFCCWFWSSYPPPPPTHTHTHTLPPPGPVLPVAGARVRSSLSDIRNRLKVGNYNATKHPLDQHGQRKSGRFRFRGPRQGPARRPLLELTGDRWEPRACRTIRGFISWMAGARKHAQRGRAAPPLQHLWSHHQSPSGFKGRCLLCLNT